MKRFSSIGAMRKQALSWRDQSFSIALVPTMGALHDGHAALIRKARRLADRVVVSVFVNPIQFGPREDLASYPRTAKQDAALCRDMGVDALFFPAAADMYEPDHSVFVEETELSRSLCGRTRPGHFRGVATVVLKLLNMAQPQFAVFGQKDAQQAAVVRRMVRDLNCPVRIAVVPTVREKDGLAMSSRNVRLSPAERAVAPTLWRALQAARRLCRNKPRSPAAVRKTMEKILRAHGRAIAIEYIEIVRSDTLRPVRRVGRGALVALAARIGQVRLVDNVVV